MNRIVPGIDSLDQHVQQLHQGPEAYRPSCCPRCGKAGLHRHPEPRLLAGTNFADVGWAYDPGTGRTVLLCAIDNLGKGAAGSAVHCMNLMCGFDETTALDSLSVFP